MTIRRLKHEQCRLQLSAGVLNMKTTEEVTPLSGIASQSRALGALEFGLDIQQPRFHVVAVGEPGSGRTFSVRSLAKRIAKTRPTPDDLLLLPNPTDPSEPSVLLLPAGEGRPFVESMEELHEKLVEGLRRVPDGERFKHARSRIERRAAEEEAELESALAEVGAELDLEVERVDDEIKVASLTDEEPSQESLRAITSAVEEFEEQMVEIQERVDDEMRDELKQLMLSVVSNAFKPQVEKHEGAALITAFLTGVENHVSREVRHLVDEADSDSGGLSAGIVVPTQLTEHEPGSGAPVVEVPYPTLSALFGRSHVPPDSGFPPEPGFAVAGALHQANGGYLILPAHTLLKNNVYEQLKACLLAGKFIPPEHEASYFRGTVEELLFPPIKIDVKVVLISGSGLYQELHEADPEFSQLFKVQARFEHALELKKAVVTYPQFIAGFLRSRGLPAMTHDAVVELLLYGCRLNESQTKASAQLGLIAEVATEAAYRAKRQAKTIIDDAVVREALEAAHWRGRYFQDEVQALLKDGTIRIETSGNKVGQVNAISVLSDGPQMFGKPCRVTAVTYPGQKGLVNIAREVEMSGPIHSKGVLILQGYLASRFAQSRPLMFGASLVFEQTYEAIDGDSASTTELYALVSSLSGLPIRQHFAVTGSVDQHGEVQPVGAINEKIESFFDVCNAKGLTGDQGVLIPSRNMDSLMLRTDVVDAVAENKFSIFAIDTVEDGIELLMGVAAGEVNQNGHYPDNSVFGSIQARLDRYHEVFNNS
jgi:predicted ATP-dependent protease